MKIGLVLPRDRPILHDIGTGLDLRFCQPYRKHAPDVVRPPNRRGMNQHQAPRQPVPGIDDQSADRPGPVIEQEIADGSDRAVAGLDLVSLDADPTCNIK